MTSSRPSFAKKYAVVWPVALVAASTYFGVEHLSSRLSVPEHDFAVALDGRIPFLPWTIWLYMPAWIVFFHVVIALVRSWDTFVRGIASVAVASVAAYAVFLVLPASYPRPDFVNDGSPTLVLLSLIRAVDMPNNTFPSLHVAISFSVGLALWREDRVRGRAVLLFALVPSLATLTVKQHFVVDVVGGAALAVFTHFAVYGLAELRRGALTAPSRASPAPTAARRGRGSAR